MKKILIILFILCLSSCLSEPKIIINRDHIINHYWNDKNYSIKIEKMFIKKDSILNIFDSNFKESPNNWDIANKLEVDSSFVYSYTGLGKRDVKVLNKIYFNKSNQFSWNFGDTFYNHKKTDIKVIGELQKSTWYKFSNLKSMEYYIYVFVDSDGNIHRFNQNLSNF